MSTAPSEPTRPSATSPLRLWGYAAVLAAAAFSQAAGRMVADTKFDLVTAPGRFLAQALNLWDGNAAFGQVQNQAYGYAWPMGPFFWLGELAHLPEWAVQRLWWTVLLWIAFFGIVKLAKELDLGSPGGQVLAAFAYVLTPRITTLLGATSIEIWPMALAPWVLVPLVRGSRTGSVRRSAALSALVVACCGGVNAVAVAAVLPLGVIWLVTRSRGPRRWRLLSWWTGLTVLATLWWSLPLLLLGRYAAPFLDYIENAGITALPTGLSRTLLGQSDWVAYFAGYDYPAGQQLVTTSFLAIDAAAVVALGLLGLSLRSNPHQRFLTLGLLTGVALVGLGYTGDLAGFFAEGRNAALDEALAPLRNLHKFDVVLRIPLVLGLAHAFSRLPELLRDAGPRAATVTRLLQGTMVVVLIGLTLPWVQDRVAPQRGVEEVPQAWYDAAHYLAETDDGTRSLVVPAAAFGVYDWGNTHDDVLQGLAESPWGVRNVIPLAQPGNVVFLDAVTRVLESGRPSDTLAAYLAGNGVGRLVVRNDLDRFQTGAPDPALVRAVLDGSPGIELDRSFGDRVGSDPVEYPNGGTTRVIHGSGLAAETGEIDVYEIEGTGSAYLTSGGKALVGDPGSALGETVLDTVGVQGVLAEDADDSATGQVLTDDTRRRETNFAAVRSNTTETLARNDPYRLSGPENSHRFLEDPERWQTTAAWTGDIGAVTASSAESYADALPPLQRGSHPGAAVDGDPRTAWRSARQLNPTGQFWQANFADVTDLSDLSITMSADSVAVPALELASGDETATVPAPAPGETRRYRAELGFGDELRITVAGRDLVLPGSVGIAEVAVAGVEGERVLDLPAPDPRFPVDTVSLTRDPGRPGCLMVQEALTCVPGLAAPGEEGDVLARRLTLPYADTYELSGTVSLVRTTRGDGLLPSGGRLQTEDVGEDENEDEEGSPTTTTEDVAQGPLAAVDGDTATTWIPRTGESLAVRLPRVRTIRWIGVEVNPGAPASEPTRIRVTTPRKEIDLDLDEDGRARLPRGFRPRQITVSILGVRDAYDVQGQQFVPLPGGISELLLDDRSVEPLPSVPVTYPCGTGPDIEIGGQVVETAVRASSRDLVRGTSVPLLVCGDDRLDLAAGSLQVEARPNDLFRVDTLRLERPEATSADTTTVDVAFDTDGQGATVTLPERDASSVLTLPQNVNDGWTAELDGQELVATRSAGWMQAWTVPAGAAGEVRLVYAPGPAYQVALGIGAGAVLVVLVIALVPPRRRTTSAVRPALGAGRPALLDLVTVAVVAGLVAGWWGLGVAALAVAVGLRERRDALWGAGAAACLVVVGMTIGASRFANQTWAVTWQQGWSLAAVGFVIAALAGARSPAGLRIRPGTSPDPGSR